MLRSPLAIFGEYRFTTVGVVLSVAMSLWLVAALLAAAVQVQSATEHWWDQFVPVVYLEAQVGSETADELRADILEWSQVESVEIEGPDEVLARLQEHLGEEEARQTGVDASMMPTALVVRPHLWRPGEVEVIARLEALNVRSAVLAVDAPEAGALSWLQRARQVVLGLAIVVFFGVGASLVGLAAFLRRLQELERRENHLLEIFGATALALRRPALWRGMILGAAAGTVAAAGFWPWSIMLDGFAVELVGSGTFTPVDSALWAGALVPAGVVLGAITGWICGRPTRTEETGKMQTLLDWQKDST